MTWLWIILRYLFPADPIRQGAEAIRYRVAELIHIAQDEAMLAELLASPALRLFLERVILDAEDTLRLWITMRACQIARIRLGAPWSAVTPHLTRAKDLPELLARIAALVAERDAMEKRAQSHAEKLKRMRDADPPAAHGSTDAWLRHAAHHEAVGVAKVLSGIMVSSGAMPRMAARPSNHEAVLTALSAALSAALSQGPPHSIAGANP
jgi:hypothetical protein